VRFSGTEDVRCVQNDLEAWPVTPTHRRNILGGGGGGAQLEAFKVGERKVVPAEVDLGCLLIWMFNTSSQRCTPPESRSTPSDPGIWTRHDQLNDPFSFRRTAMVATEAVVSTKTSNVSNTGIGGSKYE
jgi:hypothetical protein